MALDRKATKKTDDEFYANHPEMVDSNGKRKPIDPKNPAHQGYQEEWKDGYQKNKVAGKSSASKTKKAGAVKETCSALQKPCCLTSFEIKCGHEHVEKSERPDVTKKPRKYKLELPLKPDSKVPAELHVIAGDKEGDKITLSLKAKKCHQDKPGWPNIWVEWYKGTAWDARTDPRKLEMDVFAKDIVGDAVGDLDWDGFKDVLWPIGSTPQEYNIRVYACEGADPFSAILKVYPDVKWEIAVTFSLGGKRSSTAVVTKELDTKDHEGRYSDQYFKDADYVKTYASEKQTTSWGVKGKLSLTTNKGKRKTEFGPKFEKYIKESWSIARNIKDFSDSCSSLLNSMNAVSKALDGGELTYEWPSITFFGNLEMKEQEDNYGVVYSGNLGFKFAPLIRAKYTADILNWVIGVANGPAPGLGKLLNTIKTRLEKGFKKGSFKGKGEISIKFSIDGSIAGEMSWEHEVKGTNEEQANNQGSGWKPSGKLEVPVLASIIAKASGEVGAFGFAAEAGIAGGGRTGFSVTWVAERDEAGLYFQGQAKFHGFKVVYITYAGIKRQTEKPDPKEGGGYGVETSSVDKRESEMEAGYGSAGPEDEDKWEEKTLVEPRFWPENPEKHRFLKD